MKKITVTKPKTQSTLQHIQKAPLTKTRPIIGKNRNDLREDSKRSESDIRKPTKNLTNISGNYQLIKPMAKITDERIIRRTAEIESIRKEIKDYYLRSNTRRLVIPKWKEVIQLIQPLDIRLLLIAIKVLGDMYVEFDDYETAKNLYSFYKIMSFRLELLEETMYAYEALGNVYKFLYQYHKAIKCYKKMIETSWILNNRTVELRGYDHIGIQYFYLGNKEKAKFYHDRMIYGLYEKDTKIKENVIALYKNRHYHLFYEDKFVKNIKTPEELVEKFKRQISLYEIQKTIDLDTYELLRNQEMMKNSFISDVDMSFQVIHEKYLTHDYSDEGTVNGKKDKGGDYDKYKSSSSSKYKKNDTNNDKAEKEDFNQIDNLILSHLSTKRKDYSNERFERIFRRFDEIFKELFGNRNQA